MGAEGPLPGPSECLGRDPCRSSPAPSPSETAAGPRLSLLPVAGFATSPHPLSCFFYVHAPDGRLTVNLGPFCDDRIPRPLTYLLAGGINA